MEKKKLGSILIEQITGLFFPIIHIITATSILKSVLVLLAGFHLLPEEGGIYRIYYACADGFFYFLPFFLAYTASKQWKTDPFITFLIPVTLLYPDITAVLETGGSMEFLNLTVPPSVYHSSVMPVLFAAGLLFFVEKPCDKWIPEAVRGFLKPIICCLIVLPVTLIVFGPLGSLIGNFLTGIFFRIYYFNPVLAGAFMGFVMQPMVVVGAHWSIVPVCINNIAVQGYDVIMPLVGGAVYAQAGAALMVGVFYQREEKNTEKKRIAYQAALAAALGVTEPALFGVNVPLVRPMLTACLAGAVGGALAGAAGARCNSFAFPSFLTCVAYVGPGFFLFLFSMAAGFLLAVLFMLLQKKKICALLKNN